MSDARERLAANVRAVRRHMADAARRSGRSPDDVRLVAVTKYVDASVARWLAEAGCRDLGESRPQSLWQKAEVMQEADVCWHLIGHLQRNKIRRTLPLVTMLHSVDSYRLLDALQEEAARTESQVTLLIEVNVSGDAEKTGFKVDQLSDLPDRLPGWPHLAVCGLMAMSGYHSDLHTARQEFIQLREFRDRLQQRCPPDVKLTQLSMGMSRDYEVAIEEGATIVRVGSALFEGVTA